jgi:hypothetical protein
LAGALCFIGFGGDMKMIDKKDLSDIHRRIDVINNALIEICRAIPVELGHVTAEDIIESLEQNSYEHQ